jgi:hypothetical protein
MTREAHKFIDSKIYYKKQAEETRDDFKPTKKQENDTMKKTKKAPVYDDLPPIETEPAKKQPPAWLKPKLIKEALDKGLLTIAAAREIVEQLPYTFEIPKFERKVRSWEQGLSYAKDSVKFLGMLAAEYGGPKVKALLDDAKRALRERLEELEEIQRKGNDK